MTSKAVMSPKKPASAKKAASVKKATKADGKEKKKKSVGGKKAGGSGGKKTGPYTQWKGEAIPIHVPARRKETSGGGAFTAVAWNVGGLRSFIEKKSDTLIKLFKQEKPDFLALCEHKLQESHVPDMKKKFTELFPDYESHWTCSTTKKGYSGVVVLVKKEADVKEITTGLLGQKDEEGRVITVKYPTHSVVMVYTPNAGQDLKRIDYRLNTWDPDFRKHVNQLNKKPVVVIGDLNAAHLDVDIWNVEAPHIPKSAGTTKEERESFGKLLSDCKLVDSWRSLHGQDTLGHFTYWSVRARNRGTNRGLRLDYTLVSEGTKIEDAFTLPDFAPAGDHCPIGARIALGGGAGKSPKKATTPKSAKKSPKK